MNAAQFLEIIQKTNSLDGSEIVQVQKVQKNFPYFQIPYILEARYEFQNEISEKSSALAYAAITSPDRVWMKTQIERKRAKEILPEEEKKEEVAQGNKAIDLIKAISKKEVKLESIKEIEANQNIKNQGAGSRPIIYNLSAATMRLTIVIEVEYINTSNANDTLKRPYTFFKDYDPLTTSFSDMESKLIAEIAIIIQDIFTSTVSSNDFTYIQAKRTYHVNASQFLEILHNSNSLDRGQILQLQKVQENFPYFQIPHVLIARYEYQKDGTVLTPAMGYAAITSPDRIWLKTLVEKPGETLEELQEVVSTPEVKTKEEAPIPIKEEVQSPVNTSEDIATPEPVKPKPRRRKPPKDDLMETIKRKEKKEILDEKKKQQIDLIKAFSKKSIKMATIKEIEANQNTENLAAASTKINDNLISESYAKILANQGKKQLAIEIYEKLVLKFPDKRTYFADLIEKLKD
ncbi:hypothetical protein [uncultured Algoriphagus sp.]|uniref:hypothetical protein n=1 Tax=uncultured Algoriphagus sp. TaxID=417365 RepID=UPI0030ED1B50